MKAIIFNILVLFILLSCTPSRKILKEAESHFETLEYDLAINAYKESFDHNPTNEVAYKLAVSYLKKREFKEAEYWYTWYKQSGEMSISNLYDLVEIYIGNSKFEDAKSCLADIATIDELETATQKWQMLNKSVFQAKDLLNVNASYILMPLKSVNTAFSEFGYTQFRGQKYFISDRMISSSARSDSKRVSDRYGWTGNGFLQVFVGEFDTLKMDLQKITSASEFSGELHFGPIYIDSTFSFNTYTPKEVKAKIGKWEEIIPKINFIDNVTGKSRLIPSLPENFLTDPFWDAKSQKLYFAADFSGGFGNLDLYYTQFSSGNWQTPVNLGSRINSFGIERSPFISQDTLYFSSDGLGGLGGLDIYKIALIENQKDSPSNMGVPFNSNKDDFFFFIDSSLEGTQFLSSDRDGGMGMDDIYYISSIPKELIRKIIVKVTDDLSGEPLENMAVAFQRQGSNLNQNLITNELGLVDFNVNKLDTLIDINVYGSGYLNFELSGLDVNKYDTVFVAVQKLILNTPLVFDDILYDFDQYSIRPSENESLEKLVSNLMSNPGLKVELRSHTDTRGTESYNKKLSENRSISVENFLIKGGVEKSRVFVRSYGELYPLVNCGDNCSENEHQLNRRTEIIFFYGGFKNIPYSYPSINLDSGTQNSVNVTNQMISNAEGAKEENELGSEETLGLVNTAEMDPEEVSTEDSNFFYVIVGSFESIFSAQEKAEELKTSIGINAFIIMPMDAKNRYRVAIERYPTSSEASGRKEYYKLKLKRKDIWILYLQGEEALFNKNMNDF